MVSPAGLEVAGAALPWRRRAGEQAGRRALAVPLAPWPPYRYMLLTMSSALTDGISVAVRSDFRPDRSEPRQHRWCFTYTVTIRNEGTTPAQLVSRRWLITDGAGRREEVEGEGVVGRQPRLEPGQAFEYTSYCVLPTSHGSMRGSYRMARDDGTPFDAEIAPFPLVVPGTLN